MEGNGTNVSFDFLFELLTLVCFSFMDYMMTPKPKKLKPPAEIAHAIVNLNMSAEELSQAFFNGQSKIRQISERK